MTIATKFAAEIEIGEALVRACSREQHPDLAGLPLIDLGEGWDNRLYRLRRSACVHPPAASFAAALIDRHRCDTHRAGVLNPSEGPQLQVRRRREAPGSDAVLPFAG